MGQSKVDLAKEYAKEFHKSHKRTSGVSYYRHVENTLENLKRYNIEDEATLITAVLHHVLEFEPSKESEIEKMFGVETLNLLNEHKKFLIPTIKNISLDKEENQKSIIPMYFNLVSDPRALIIRLADRVDNLKSAHLLEKELAVQVAKKALYVYAQIARILGLSSFSRDLEDTAFKIINPHDYFLITKYIKSRESSLLTTFNEIEKVILEILTENNINSLVEYRVKHAYSIYKKLLKYREKRGFADISHIYDIGALRVIVGNLEDCYTVESIFKQLWEDVPDQRDDYIQNPKESGYKSIHNVFQVERDLQVEVQIKTREMHEENEFGRASHTFYKIGKQLIQGNKVSVDAKKTNWLKEVNFMETGGNIKIDHFAEYIYVFTPKGDIVELPKDSTLIDFAYEIHGTIGHSAVNGLVNGQIKKLTDKLQNGDRVEIITSKNKTKPNSDWFNSVKTSKAKILIKKALKKDLSF